MNWQTWKEKTRLNKPEALNHLDRLDCLDADGPDSDPVTAAQGPQCRHRFMVIDRGHWDRLWQIPTSNRMNLVTAFLVLLAGTGADHRATRWSAAAAERYVGMGRPRFQFALQELIGHGLVEMAPSSRRNFPHYRLAAPDDARKPFFVPFEALTGVPVLINTSFNIKGEPIVETPRDAMRCFLTTGIDHLVLHDTLVSKNGLHKIVGPLVGIYTDVGAVVMSNLKPA